jgi:hypothetical protein
MRPAGLGRAVSNLYRYRAIRGVLGVWDLRELLQRDVVALPFDATQAAAASTIDANQARSEGLLLRREVLLEGALGLGGPARVARLGLDAFDLGSVAFAKALG